MDRYFTLMVIPEREKVVRSLRIPRVLFRALLFIFVLFIAALSILSYDYLKILQQVYKNKHLTIENRQLKEQIQLFQMKINSLTEDIERIHTFEKKLRIITGVEDFDMTQSLVNPATLDEDDHEQGTGPESGESPPNETIPKSSSILSPTGKKFFSILLDNKNVENAPEFQQLKNLYEQKIATELGQQTAYSYTKEWSELSKRSFALAGQYAKFDYQFSKVKVFVKNLEVKIHELDQYLLDKASFLRSTPTLLPTRGWITSYYGPRNSHYAKRIKMHEGLDIGAKSGKPIVATADGIITFSGKKPGFGNFVKIDHGYGIETIYAHAQQLIAKKGNRVLRGDAIARVGSTGYSTGPHVHYEVRVNDTPVDPLYFILD